MTVVDLRGADARAFLSHLLANDVSRLQQPGKALYSCMLNEQGHVIDDLITYFMDEQWFRLVVNAATREKALAWLRRQSEDYQLTVDEQEVGWLGAAGGMVDAALGGASLFVGALVGAGIGATTAAYASGKLVEVKVLHLPLGRRMLVAGPMTNVNFPHVVFARARLHRTLVAGRSHAQRGELNTRTSVEEVCPPLPGNESRRLERIFDRIRRGRDVVADTEELAEVIENIFAKDDSPSREARQAPPSS